MTVPLLVIAGIVVLILLFVVVKFITGCLPKIIILGVLGALAYLAYVYLIK